MTAETKIIHPFTKVCQLIDWALPCHCAVGVGQDYREGTAMKNKSVTVKAVRPSIGNRSAKGRTRPTERGWARAVLSMRFFGTPQSLTARGTGSLIRPLISLSRDDVKKLCRFWGLPIYPDLTNQEIAFSRNRIRKQVLPALRLALNPQVDNVLFRSAEIMLAERLHGDFLAWSLGRAAQPLSALSRQRLPQTVSDSSRCRGLLPSPHIAPCGVMAPNHRLALRPHGDCGSHAASLQLPKMGGVEMIGPTCPDQNNCPRLLLQRSRCLFLPQVGGLFVNSRPTPTSSTSLRGV